MSLSYSELFSFQLFSIIINNKSSVMNSAALYVLPREGIKSEEVALRLEVSIESHSFLKNIVSYGDARMARRAVGILEKMVLVLYKNIIFKSTNFPNFLP